MKALMRSDLPREILGILSSRSVPVPECGCWLWLGHCVAEWLRQSHRTTTDTYLLTAPYVAPVA